MASRQSSKRAPPSLFFGPAAQDVMPPDALHSPTSSSPPNTTATTASTGTNTPAQTASRPGFATATSQRSQSQLHSLNVPQRPRQPSATAETWTALQSTLEEVELNALSGASVFGAEHSRALEELRKAQVELARAWARGEGDTDGDGEGFDDASTAAPAGGDAAAREISGDGAASSEGQIVTPGTRSAVLSRDRGPKGAASGGRDDQGVRRSAATAASGKTKLEEETEADINMARKRRLANDRYFERVNKGVVDVVAKLELVAQKMGGVEMESEEIWGEDSDSSDGPTG